MQIYPFLQSTGFLYSNIQTRKNYQRYTIGTVFKGLWHQNGPLHLSIKGEWIGHLLNISKGKCKQGLLYNFTTQASRLPHKSQIIFKFVHNCALKIYKPPFTNKKEGQVFFPLFLLLHVTLDLQKSYKLGLTGWLDRFIAPLYPCNSRQQAKHSQI